jgi:DNA repair protein RadC
LAQNATCIIVCHNHPSGHLKPSTADIKLTKNLVDAGKLLQIDVIDHIIVSESGHFSFADNQMI